MAVGPYTRRIKGTVGNQRAVGKEIIQIPFSDLGLKIDVRFITSNYAVSTMISNKDLWSNGLVLSIQACVITYTCKKQETGNGGIFSSVPVVPEGFAIRTVHRV